ncbi:Uncharacterised protein [Mycobacteroides abscessus subsp. abscessus]|nr:Uncharacterised protein [Mycobacteroides abscessus subsp. abscessus]
MQTERFPTPIAREADDDDLAWWDPVSPREDRTIARIRLSSRSCSILTVRRSVWIEHGHGAAKGT